MNDNDINELQKETVESINEYLTNLIPAMDKMVAELRGDILEDTWEYLRMIIDGFNWVIEAYNGTKSFFESNQKSIDDTDMESAVKELSHTFHNKEALETSNILEGTIIPFLKNLKAVSEAF